jgi:acetoin utilization deacetylase AcuC-like enzyme
VYEQLIYEEVISRQQVVDAGICSDEEIVTTHSASYWQQLKTLQLSDKAVRKIGLPITHASVNRARSSSKGTLFAARTALQKGLGLNLAGGTHHAFTGHGEGFCILNDMAIAANVLLKENLVSNILVIDLDVHQGNGTAAIFQSRPEVFTFSMHGDKNYPHQKTPSDRDVALAPGTNDRQYLELLAIHLKKLFEELRPDLVFYQAGVDVLATDKLGTLSLTKTGCAQRDAMVIDHCARLDIPLAIVMGGGYSERLADIVDAHCNTFKKAIDRFS